MSYYPEPDSHSREQGNFEEDLCNYATKSGAKQVKGIDTPDFAKKADLYSLKSKVDKLDVHRLETVPANLNKVGNVVDNDIADAVNDIDTSELVKEVNAFDTSDLVRKLPTTYKR